MTPDERLDLLRLNLVPGIGPRTQTLLLERFGTAARVFQASGPELLQVDGIGPKLSAAITAARTSEAANRELDRCRDANVTLRYRGTPDYPKLLATMCDAPRVLYCRGELLPQDELSIALVGSRRCTLYGRQQAERLAGALARAGMTIVSGLARGIDAAAHRGALAARGRTLAVCATGLSKLYPPEHKDLAREIVASGAVLSESPLDRGPSRGIFPQRNRIISGLSLGVIIVEASRQSGALHTARHAMEQGREVFAVPGRIDSLASAGCHDLIRDGATLIRDPDDVLAELGPLLEPVARGTDDVVLSPRELALDDQEREVLNLLSQDPQHVDQVIAAGGLEPSRVLSTLTVLEMRRMVHRLPGGMYVRATH
ncbi:MAG: DNA-processing protein DprA [Planctomycetaceae bacterium]|nr:DNA-processing protein DprA [Planctomycetaceae bacterium]